MLVSNASWIISSFYEVFWYFYQVPKDNLFSIHAHFGKIWITFFMCSLPKKISFLAEKLTARYQRYFTYQILYLLWLIFNTEYPKSTFFSLSTLLGYTQETNSSFIQTLMSKIRYHFKTLLKQLMNICIFIFKHDDMQSSYAFLKPTTPYICNIRTSFRVHSFVFPISQINRYDETYDLQYCQISIYVK